MRWLGIATFLLHCSSSQPEPATPPAAPSGEPVATPTPTPTAEAASAPSAQPSAEASAAPAPGALKNPPSKQPCGKLDKTTCKVTVGCAWNDKQKCITEETR